MESNIEQNEQVTLRVRLSQRNVDYLTAFAILDDTTIGQQARYAVEQWTPEPEDVHWYADGRDRIRKVELQVPEVLATRLGALAADCITNIGQVMHQAVDRYTEYRLGSPELQEALDQLNRQDTPPDRPA